MDLLMEIGKVTKLGFEKELMLELRKGWMMGSL
jgi:hypothetical protein